MGAKYDFSGWATKNDLKCSDGRTIRKGAFKHNDGQIVPLVWHHLHNDPMNVLGHCLLQDRPEGVYAYGVFNETENGLQAKELVMHGDVNKLSIYANRLDQRGGDVYHGDIKEVSLVLAGANPGAVIEFPVLEHSGEESYDEAIIRTGEEIIHGDIEGPENMSNDHNEDETLKHAEASSSEGSESGEGESVEDVFNTLSTKQKDAVYSIINEIINDDNDDDDDDVEHSDYHDDDDDEGENTMKHNVFDTDTRTNSNHLSHDDMAMIFRDAKRLGSLKDAVLTHMEEGGVLSHAVYNHDDDGNETTKQTYGIADVRYLFPDARNLNTPPDFISREMGWVQKVMGGTHHTPFSRIKSMFANITNDEARALGYFKGNLKKEEVFGLLKRTTDPQTIYKKQKMDRDDVIDITDFDVVAWLKREMRMMLDEEIARAVLVGDGRTATSDDHISEDHIRSIYHDAALYTIQTTVNKGTTDELTVKNFIRAAIKSRIAYKGSGNPTLFTTEEWLTDMLLLEDGVGRLLYDNASQLANVLRVKEIVTVPVMEGLTNATGEALGGIIVNLVDYNIGADKGGEVNMFDDFDIDYNQMKYLIETRISGALIKPYSAIVLNIEQ